jgi:hypothetical protein
MDRLRWSYSQATKVPRLYSFRFLSVGMDGKRSVQIKSKHDKLVVCIMNSGALLKQECQDNLRRATHTFVKRVGKCVEVDGCIFEHLL